MPELKNGCLLLRECISFQKEMKNKNGKSSDYVIIQHEFYHLIDKTGDNKEKVEVFNRHEERRLEMTRMTMDILVSENSFDVKDDVDEQHIEYRKHPKSPLDGCTLAEFRKVAKVVPMSDDDEEEDEQH